MDKQPPLLPVLSLSFRSDLCMHNCQRTNVRDHSAREFLAFVSGVYEQCNLERTEKVWMRLLSTLLWRLFCCICIKWCVMHDLLCFLWLFFLFFFPILPPSFLTLALHILLVQNVVSALETVLTLRSHHAGECHMSTCISIQPESWHITRLQNMQKKEDTSV